MHLPPDNKLTLLIPPDVPASACLKDGRELFHAGDIFGTQWSLCLLRKGSTNPANDEAYREQVVKACRQTLELIDSQMSLWRANSLIAQYNRLPAGKRLSLHDPMATVVRKALVQSEKTGGAFHPGLYEAVEHWGFGATNIEHPIASGLAFARRRNGAQPPRFRMEGSELEKTAEHSLDLNGIAKGYAVDLLCDLIRSHPDTASCLVEIGGELKGFGTRADGMPFWTELASSGDPGTPAYRAALYGWACATSGESERSHQAENIVYSHIIDPRTNASSTSDLIAATVFDKECAKADALATALIVMGASKALTFAYAHNIPCVLTHRDQAAPILSEAMIEWA